MKVCILGGCGFIGGNLAKSLIDDNHIVTVVDMECTEANTLQQLGVTVVKADLTKNINNKVRDQLIKADIIFHFASSVGVKLIDADPHKHICNMYELTNNLLPIFQMTSARVIFASTSEVYGNNTNATEGDDLTIGDPQVLRWGYACNKLMTEFMLKSYKINHTVVRFFNITGFGQRPTSGMVLPSFVYNAKNNTDITIYGNGKQIRSFCDIRDAIKMLEIIMHDNIHSGETYNIGNQNNYTTIYDLASKVVKLIGSNSKIKYKQYSDEFTCESKDIMKRCANTTKIEKLYKPRFSLDDIIISLL